MIFQIFSKSVSFMEQFYSTFSTYLLFYYFYFLLFILELTTFKYTW